MIPNLIACIDGYTEMPCHPGLFSAVALPLQSPRPTSRSVLEIKTSLSRPVLLLQGILVLFLVMIISCSAIRVRIRQNGGMTAQGGVVVVVLQS